MTLQGAAGVARLVEDVVATKGTRVFRPSEHAQRSSLTTYLCGEEGVRNPLFRQKTVSLKSMWGLCCVCVNLQPPRGLSLAVKKRNLHFAKAMKKIFITASFSSRAAWSQRRQSG